MKMKEILNEIEYDILHKVYDEDVRQATNKLLRYLKSTFVGVQFDYELVIIGDNADSDKFVARLLVTYPKEAVATQSFINFISDKHYSMAEADAFYIPRYIGQDSLPDMEMFAFDFDWSVSAYKELIAEKRRLQILNDAKHKPKQRAKKNEKHTPVETEEGRT